MCVWQLQMGESTPDGGAYLELPHTHYYCRSAALRPIAKDVACQGCMGTAQIKPAIDAIEQKGSDFYTEEDIKSANVLASNIVKGVIEVVEFTRGDTVSITKRMRQIITTGDVFGLSTSGLCRVAEFLNVNGAEVQKSVFLRCLKIAQVVHNANGHNKEKPLLERRKAYSRTLTLCSATRILNPQDPYTENEYAFALLHTGKPLEAEKAWERIAQKATGQTRRATTSMGFSRLETARAIYSELTSNLTEADFLNALTLAQEAETQARCAIETLSEIAIPFIQGKNTRPYQVPRALSGIAAAELILADIRVFSLSNGLTENRRYSTFALMDIIRALENCARAIKVSLENDTNALTDPVSICNSALRKLEQSRDLLGENLLNEYLIKRLIRVFDDLSSIPQTNVREDTKAGLSSIRCTSRGLRANIEQQIVLCNRVRALVIEGIRAIINSDTGYDDIEHFYSDLLERHIVQQFPQEMRKMVRETFSLLRGAEIDFDLEDLFILRAYFLADDKTPEAVTEAAQALDECDLDTDEVERRFKKSSYLHLGVSLAITTEQPEEEIASMVDTTPSEAAYADGDVANFLKIDLTRIEQLVSLHTMLCPWMDTARAEKTYGLIDDARERFGKFQKTAGQYLANVDSKNLIGRKEKLSKLNAMKQAREAKRTGYIHTVRRAEALLKDEEGKAKARIREAREKTDALAAAAKWLTRNFELEHIGILGARVGQLSSGLTALLDDRNEMYLSAEQFEELRETIFNLYAPEILRASEISKSQEFARVQLKLRPLAKKADDFTENEQQGLADDLIAMTEEIKTGFFKTVFRANNAEDIARACEGASCAIEEIQRTTEQIIILFKDHQRLGCEIIDAKAALKTSTLLLPNDELRASLERAGFCIDSTIALFDEMAACGRQDLSYDNFPLVRSRFTDYERQISIRLQEATLSIKEADRLKSGLIIPELTQLLEMFRVVKIWYEGMIATQPPAQIVNIHTKKKEKELKEALEEVESMLQEAIDILSKEFFGAAGEMMYDKNKALFNCLEEAEKKFGILLVKMIDYYGEECENVNVFLTRSAHRLMSSYDPAYVEVRSLGAKVLLDKWGFPLDFAFCFMDWQGRALFYETGKAETDINREEIRHYFNRWRDFKGSGPFATPEVLFTLQKAFEYYVILYLGTTNLGFKTLDNAIGSIYDLSFEKVLDYYTRNPSYSVYTGIDREYAFYRYGYGHRTRQMGETGKQVIRAIMSKCNFAEAPEGIQPAAEDEFLQATRQHLFGDSCFDSGVLNVFLLLGDFHIRREEKISIPPVKDSQVSGLINPMAFVAPDGERELQRFKLLQALDASA